ncbi:MAG: hypothetical protein DI569_12045 [Sphingopyxis macrogoltabida]|uniref:DUF4189 domain-containing protein n=1 Tax=Sphingopyxis macrogoltabida TaxID=33050 RepID=A0A2W5KZG9_SPHMC|nr:MAG: hypothetical protein DI569_12045 [Sphingopyxis macrogoltabida]
MPGSRSRHILFACILSLVPVAGHAQMQPIQGIPCAQGLPCTAPPPQVLDQMHGGHAAPPGQILPVREEVRGGYMVNSFAAIAFWRSASGQPGYSYGALRGDRREQAEQYAMDACRSAGGRDCVIGLWGANGHFVIGRDSDGEYRAAFAGTPNAARRELMKSCKNAGTKCKVVETLESMPYYFTF